MGKGRVTKKWPTWLIAMFGGVLGYYAISIPATDSVMMKARLGDQVFRIPQRYSAMNVPLYAYLREYIEKGFSKYGEKIDKIGGTGNWVDLLFRAEEMAELVEGYQTANHRLKADLHWSVAHRVRSGRFMRRFTDKAWNLRDRYENATVIRHPSGFYKIMEKGEHRFWAAIRMPPRPGQPTPQSYEEFWIAFCHVIGTPHAAPGSATCRSTILLPQDLEMTFDVYDQNLHLHDRIVEVLTQKLESWREKP